MRISDWSSDVCSSDLGAGTMHPATFLRALGPEPWRAAYVQPSRRPSDARYGENPNRLGKYFQYQVILKPSPDDVQDVYLDKIGSASCRERVCQYVSISVGAGHLKKNMKANTQI